MWYRVAKEPDKQNPEELVKAIDLFALNAIKNSLRLKRVYSPSERLLKSWMQRVHEKIVSDYQSASNLVLFTNGSSLKYLVEQIVDQLINK